MLRMLMSDWIVTSCSWFGGNASAVVGGELAAGTLRVR